MRNWEYVAPYGDVGPSVNHLQLGQVPWQKLLCRISGEVGVHGCSKDDTRVRTQMPQLCQHFSKIERQHVPCLKGQLCQIIEGEGEAQPIPRMSNSMKFPISRRGPSRGGWIVWWIYIVYVPFRIVGTVYTFCVDSRARRWNEESEEQG